MSLSKNLNITLLTIKVVFTPIACRISSSQGNDTILSSNFEHAKTQTEKNIEVSTVAWIEHPDNEEM